MKRTILSFAIVFSSMLFFAANAYTADDSATKAMLATYEKVRAALADDNLDAAKQAATGLAETAAAAKNESIVKSANSLTASSNLEKAREQFKAISQEVIPMVKGKSGYYVITCSMAKASWVQTDKTVQNPYMGQAMLSCGAVEESFPDKESSHSHSKSGCCR